MSVVVIYYSGYGHTKRVAETVAEGARADLIAIDGQNFMTIVIQACDSSINIIWHVRFSERNTRKSEYAYTN